MEGVTAKRSGSAEQKIDLDSGKVMCFTETTDLTQGRGRTE